MSILLLTAARSAHSQSFTANVRGTVTDQSGSSIPGAKVVISDVERGTKHTTETDEAGRYSFTALQPGSYVVNAEAPGFKRFSSDRITLVVQQQATVDIAMQLGETSTTVEVKGSAALVNTTIANLGQVIENKYIISLPNIARDPMMLTYLTPGVVGSGGRRGDTNTNFVANGSRNSTADVLLDGVTVVTVEQNSGITDLKYKPSVDAVQEFKMQTNFFSAEYGQTGTAVVNMITKSGTNDFHGTGYYFLRHSDLNANSWFSNANGKTIPYYRRDQLGGVVGGPVIKNKTFFFATYEYTKAKSPLGYSASVPTLKQREGDFSETLNPKGKPVTIYNPFDTFTNADRKLERRPFPGNKIDCAALNPVTNRPYCDPVALAALKYFPKPNQPGNRNTQTDNWFEEAIRSGDSQQINLRGDHNFTDRTRLSGRYSRGWGSDNPPNLFKELAPAYPFNDGPNTSMSTSIVAELTKVQSTTSVWTIRYGLTYSTYVRNPMENFDLTKLGFPQYMKDQATFQVFPKFSPDGYLRIGTEGWLIMDRQEGVHHISGSYAKTKGAHSMKAGAETRRNFLDYAQPGYPSGQFSFGRGVTCRLQESCGSDQEGNGVATMLLGWATGSDFHIDPKVFTRSAYWGFYFQDDWKVTRKLTLNLGLRYDFDLPRWEVYNRQSYWDLSAQSPVQAAGYDTRGVIRFADDNHRSPFDKDMNNWGPRLGLAYALTPKTAIRAGVGLFYQLSRATVYGHTGAGFNVNSTATFSLDSNKTRYLPASLGNPYPDGMLLPPGRSQGDATFIGLGAGTIVPSNNRNPEYYSWNLSIQRELPMQSVLEINYTGSRGTHLFLPYGGLTPLPQTYWPWGRTVLEDKVPNPFYCAPSTDCTGKITDQKAVNLKGATIQQFRLLRPMPQFDGASVGTAEPARADSYYHALQLKWEKHYSKGLTMLAHYTWSKMIDNASHGSGNYSWLGGSTSIQNIWDLRGERSLSAHDVAHRVVLTGAWEMPFGKGRWLGSQWARPIDLLLGGWQLSGLALLQSGMPLAVTQDQGKIWDGTQRPNLTGDPSTSGPVASRLGRDGGGWFNPDVFRKPLVDVPGTAPRTLKYRGPGIRTIDASLLKNFRVKEGQRFEFRIEAQNVLNHPIFSDPNTNFGSSSFGKIDQTKIGSRNVQLGMKYYF
jgi:hypothetical protein